MNNFLIPANSKKSMLILGFFTKLDLLIFGTGCIITFILMLSIRTNEVSGAFMILLPVLISTFLVLPIPNQHNVLTFFINVYQYFTGRKKYYWKGWCINYGKTDTK